jgi:hypothetical protein
VVKLFSFLAPTINLNKRILRDYDFAHARLFVNAFERGYDELRFFYVESVCEEEYDKLGDIQIDFRVPLLPIDGTDFLEFSLATRLFTEFLMIRDTRGRGGN